MNPDEGANCINRSIYYISECIVRLEERSFCSHFPVKAVYLITFLNGKSPDLGEKLRTHVVLMHSKTKKVYTDFLNLIYLQLPYFEQEADRDSTVTALDTFWAQFPSMENREVRLCLAKCGLTNEHITSQMRVLSGGENAKVRLAIVMNREHNWLILDEPTNHLDVDAKDELKRALMEYPGTILLVSHDPSFYEDFVTDIWNVEDWTTKIV